MKTRGFHRSERNGSVRGKRATSMATVFALTASLLVASVGLLAPPALADTSAGASGNATQSFPHDAWSNTTAVDNAGHVYIFWENYGSSNTRMFYQVSSDNGKTFAAARSMCSAVSGCVQNAASDSGYAGLTDTVEEEPDAFVDTTTTPPTLYVAFAASQSFSNLRPYQIRLLKSTDFGNTFTLVGGVVNLGASASTPCSTASGSTTLQCNSVVGAARGNNIYLSIGEVGANSFARGLIVSTNGGTSWSAATCNTSNGAACAGPSGGMFDPNDGYLDSSGNYWTLWTERLGASPADWVYSLSRTTAGSTATTWGGDVYRVTRGPTYPAAQLAANSGTYPDDSLASVAQSDINTSNDSQYMLIPINDSNSAAYAASGATQNNPMQSILRLGRCTTSCTNPNNWSGYNAGDLKAGTESNPRVDDKDAAGACGGTVALNTDKCTTSFATMNVNDNDVVSIQWLDDRRANTTNCNGAALGNKAWSHTCALNVYLRTNSGSYNGTNGGFTSPSVRLNDHALSSPASTVNGFLFPYGDVTTLISNPGCPTGDSTPATFSAWNEAHDYSGGNPNGGLVYYRNNQTGPASPNLGASGNDSDNNIAVSWTAVSGATQYKLSRSSNGYGANMTLYQTLGGGTTSYTDTSVSNGNEYSYTVSAVTGAGEGCQSASSQAVSGQSKVLLSTGVSPNNDPTGTPTAGSITTNPAPPDLQFKKSSKVSATAAQYPSRDADSRWRFVNWTVSPSSFADGTTNAGIPAASSSSTIAAAAGSATMSTTASYAITGGSAGGSGSSRTATVTCGSCGTGTNIVVGNQVVIAGNANAAYNVTAVVTAKTGTTITVGTGSTNAGTWTAGGTPTVSIRGASETGTTATINTTTAHALTTGAAFNVSGVTPGGYNGAWTVASTPLGQGAAQSTAAALTYSTSPTSGLGNSTVAGTVTAAGSGATESGNIVTLTTTANHSINAGDAITVAGVGVNGYNGSFTASATTTTTVTYTNATSGLADSGGGTVSVNGASLVVNETDHATEPATPFNIKVDNEQMNVTAVSGTGPYTYTVTRGFNGTTAVPHSSGATVTYPTIRTGCTTSQSSCTLQMQGPVSLTANYQKQWAVTTKVTGFNCDSAIDQVCDSPTDQKVVGESGTNLANTTFGPGELAYSGDGFPAISYVDDGGTLNYRSGYAGQKVTSVCGAAGFRGLNVANSSGFNVGDTILVSGAQVSANDAKWDGIWTVVAAGSGSCTTAANRIIFSDPSGGNGGASTLYSTDGAQLFVTDVGNSGQGSNTPSGTNLVLPTYGSNDALPDDAEGYPATFPPDANKQYRYISTVAGDTGGSLSAVNAFGSLTNVSAPTTIVVNYRTQHKIRFNQNGLGANDTSGTIATVPGFGDGATTQNFTQAQLPAPSTGGTFQDDTQAFNATFTDPVQSTSDGSKRYVATTRTYSGTKGNQSTSSFSSYALVSIASASYDANDNTETYFCGQAVACPFLVGQTVTVSGFTNPLSATLNANISASATSATVNEANHAAEPQVPFFATIDNETVNVSAVSGNGPYTYTIARAQNGSTGASHTSGTAVVYDSNCAGCANYNGDRVVTDVDPDEGSFTATAGANAPGQTDTFNATDPNLYNAQAVNYSIPTEVQQYKVQGSQTITFPAIPDHTFGDADFGISASASSNLGVNFTATGNCTVTAGPNSATVHITAPGSCSVTAHQPGDDDNDPAPDVTRTFNIAKVNQTINFGALSAKSIDDPDFAVSATASSGLTVAFSSTTPAKCTVSGTTVHIVAAGTCTIAADQAGDSNYDAAPQVTQSFTIKDNQTITGFGPIATHTYNDADFSVAGGVAATSGLAVSFTATGDCTVNGTGTTVHITDPGSCTIHADQAGDGDYNAAPQVNQTFTIDKDNQSITGFGPIDDHTFGDADFDVSTGVSATSGLAVSFTATGDCTVNAAGTTVHLTGAGSCTIHADQAGDSNYNAAPQVNQTFAIDASGNTITFPAIPTHTYGDADFGISASASSNLDVDFTASGDCTVTAGPNSATVHITGAGSCSVTAHQPGDNDYDPAPDVTRTFTINQANQTITGFGPIADHTYGDASFDVSPGVSATSGLTVTFTASGNCTVTSAGVVTVGNAGPCHIHADQAGDGNYNAAPQVTQSFTIDKADQTIMFGTIPDHTWGDADFGVTATADSGLTVVFSASGNCTVIGVTVHLTSAGSCTIHANQSGDSNYNPAPTVNQMFTINKANQTITGFGSIPAHTMGDANFNVSAGVSATSGLTVTFSASPGTVCTATNAGVVHIVGGGVCTVHADQGGNGNYNPAPQVDQSFTVNPRATTLKLNKITPNPVASGSTVKMKATAMGSGIKAVGTVEFRTGATVLASGTVNNKGKITKVFTVTLAPGSYTIKAYFIANASFQGSTSVNAKTLNVT